MGNKQENSLKKGREKQDFSAQTLSLMVVPGELGQPMGFVALNVSNSLWCIALAGRSVIPGSCPRTVPGPDR